MIEKILDLIKTFFSFWMGRQSADLQQANKNLDAVKQKEEAHRQSDARSLDDIRSRAAGNADKLWPDTH